MQTLCVAIFDTVKEAAFQNRLLAHILPTSDWIAFHRCRLAVAFLLQDASPLTELPERVLDLKRITNLLKDRRFDIKSFKRKDCVEFDYGELGAITALLNIAIDSGHLKFRTPGATAEAEPNAEVDALAGHLKKIFTSIEDSGASHFKRTQAKEALEALHYRVLYSVRSKPPPKKSFFGAYGRDDWSGVGRSGSFMEKFLTSHKESDNKIPIRAHDDSS